MTAEDSMSGEQPHRIVDTTASMTPVEVEATLDGLTHDDIEAVSRLKPGTALLVVQKGPNAGARFLLDADTTTAGRSTKSDIFFDDVTVSRTHAEFLRAGDGNFVVRDVGSLNGTYVNRDRVDEAQLKAGDEVQIGKYRLTFHPHGVQLMPPGDAEP